MIHFQSKRIIYSREDLHAHIAGHADAIARALERYCDRDNIRRGHSAELEVAEELISRREQTSFNYMNPYSRSLWIDLFLDQLLVPRFESEQFYKITILDLNWHTSERAWNIDLNRIKRDVRNRLRDVNYVLFIEFAFFRNVSDPTERSRVVAPHVEGLVWGPGCRSRINQIRHRFSGGLFGADPIHLKKVHHLAGAVRYAIKPPYKGYSVFRRTDGTYGHRTSDLTLARMFRVFEYFKEFEYSDFAFAGGEGVEVLREVRAAARRLARPSAIRDRLVRRPASHRRAG